MKSGAPVRYDWTFPRNYEIQECEYVTDAKGLVTIGSDQYTPRFFPPNIEKELERMAIIAFHIRPHHGKDWVGVFAYGFDSTYVVNAVFSCPDVERLCVVCGGYSYIVNTTNWRHWERLPVVPVVHAMSILDKDILVFGDFTRLAAYGPKGVNWTTEQLSWDGIKIAEITKGSLRGYGWEAPTGRDVEFTVNLATGDHVGGTSPRRYQRSSSGDSMR